MSIFRQLIWCALAVGLSVGTLTTLLQRWQVTPLILAAEQIEERHAHSAPAATAAFEWFPADELARDAWTWLANVLHAFALALLVLVTMSALALLRKRKVRPLTLAMVVAAAGWMSMSVWPRLGLPPELPGIDAGSLVERQVWWLLASASAATAIGIATLGASSWRWPCAAAVLALPFLVGAPLELGEAAGEPQAALRDLQQRFAAVTRWISVALWSATGLACAVAFDRFLLAALQGPRINTTARAGVASSAGGGSASQAPGE